MTMGGLMARYTVYEAVVKAIEAGVDIVLLKDDNSLRYEAHAALAEAIRSGRISDERVNQSLRRIWSPGGITVFSTTAGLARVEGLNEHLFHEDYQGVDGPPGAPSVRCATAPKSAAGRTCRFR